MPITEAITAGEQAVTQIGKNVQQRDAEKNATDVKDAAIAANEQKSVDQTNKALAEGDVQELRKELAE